MKIKDLAKELQGVYDFTNVVDCQSVISMLLNDLERQKNKVIPKKAGVMEFFGKMANNMTKVEGMTDDQLYDAGMEMWSDFDMDSTESCVLGELLRRFKDGQGNKRAS